jgi:hypothetical protein
MTPKTKTEICALIFLPAVGWLAAGSLAAQEESDKEQAKEHFYKAKSLVEEGALKKAIAEFKASYDLNPLPMVLFNIAACHDKLTEYANAMNYYKKFLIEGKTASEEMKTEAKTRIDELKKYLGLVKLTANESGADVIVDGEIVGQTPMGVFFLETGSHEVKLQKNGFFDAKKTFKIISGETVEIDLEMQKQVADVEEKKGSAIEPQTFPPPWETQAQIESKKEGEKKEKSRKKLGKAPFATMLGITAALGVTATVTGSLALVKDKKVEKMDPDDDWKRLREESDNLALGTDVLIGIMCASAVTTIVLAIFTDFGKKEKSNASAGITLTASGSLFGIAWE